MVAIVSIRRIVRPAIKTAKVSVKAVNMVNVTASVGYDDYGLNLHSCGKIEFFRNAQYAMVGSNEYNVMLSQAKAFTD